MECYENLPSGGDVLCTWCGMARKDKNNLRYIPLPDATPEGELDALAAIYAFVLECHESKQAADPTGDRNEVKEDDVDPTGSLPQ